MTIRSHGGGSEPRAVLITGVYGSGKSSVAAEIAHALERRGMPYAMLDLDYLGWAGAGADDDPTSEHRRMLRNLDAVASNYLDDGIRFFVLASFVRSGAQMDGIRTALGVPLRVVRLVVPFEEIRRRLASDVTSGRADDLLEARASIATSEGEGLDDLTVANDHPVPEVAREILRWLGW